MTLHEALIEVLRREVRFMSEEELASNVNSGGSYERGDGRPLPAYQVLMRVRSPRYAGLFQFRGQLIGLSEWGDSGPLPDQRASAPATSPPLTAAELSDLRRLVLRVLDSFDPDHSNNEAVAARIARLSWAEVIPRNVAACMRTITETRNMAEYDAKTPNAAESDAVRACWRVIEEWRNANARP